MFEKEYFFKPGIKFGLLFVLRPQPLESFPDLQVSSGWTCGGKRKVGFIFCVIDFRHGEPLSLYCPCGEWARLHVPVFTFFRQSSMGKSSSEKNVKIKIRGISDRVTTN